MYYYIKNFGVNKVKCEYLKRIENYSETTKMVSPHNTLKEGGGGSMSRNMQANPSVQCMV